MRFLGRNALALLATLLVGGLVLAQDKDKPEKDPPKEKDTFDILIKAQLKLVNEMVDVMEKIKDVETAEQALPKMKGFEKTQKDLEARMKKLGKPDKEEEEALKKKYEKDFEKAIGRLFKEAGRLQGMPEVQKILDKAKEKPKDGDKDKKADKPEDKPKDKKDEPKDK